MCSSKKQQQATVTADQQQQEDDAAIRDVTDRLNAQVSQSVSRAVRACSWTGARGPLEAGRGDLNQAT